MEEPQLKNHSPLVIRVSMKSTSDSAATDTESDGINSITLDTFICGHCQLEFVDITEFMGHRLQHKISQGHYRCELCKAPFSTQELTTEHYLDEHKVDITSHFNEQSSETKPEITEVIHVSLASPAIDKDTSNQDVRVEQGEMYNTNCNERVVNIPVAEDSPDVQNLQIQQEEDGIDDESEAVQMLKFRLHREDIVGSKFKYGRYVYCCIQCSYNAYSLPSLISHTHKSHPNVLSGDEQGSIAADDYGGSILTVSQYYAMNAKKKEDEQTLSKLKRRRKRQKKDQCRIYTCHTCQKVFQRARSLRLHMEIHRTERNYLCDECGKAFKSQIRLNAHRKVHKEKLFQCSQCDFRSSINSSIHVHRQFHRDGCVLCHVCGSAYTDKSTLKKHMQVHSLDRPFGCAFEGCTWRFKTQAMCKAHLRNHTTKGKFKCDICGYVFRHKHHLQRHQSSMHGVKTTEITDNIKLETPAGVQTEDPTPETSIHVVPVQVVVATDMQGTPIAYEQPELVDVNHLNASNYNQVLIQTSEHSQIFSAGHE